MNHTCNSSIRLMWLASCAALALHCSSSSTSDGGGGQGGSEDGDGGDGGDGGGEQGGAGQGGQQNANGGNGGSSQGGAAGGSAGAGQGGGSGGTSASGGAGGTASGGAGGGGGAGGAAIEDKRPWFSFFTTSQAGLLTFATDKAKGLGGNLGGLAGADNICMKLAQKANPGDKKVWRAFLSVKVGPNGGPVNAIDRIGKGPWYNFKNVLLAKNLQDLVPGAGDNGRPTRYMGAENNGPLLEMFTDENGDPVSPNPREVDNHDMLTGSDAMGRLTGDTCKDWTSADGAGNGKPNIGHAWPRTPTDGRHWISEHQAGGCAAGMDTRPIANNGTNTVGAGGGYGGFYCFAVTGE